MRSISAALFVVTLGLGLLSNAFATVQAATGGDSYVPLSPVRILDTRTDGSTLGAGSSLSLQVAGVGEVPATATAVAVNLTVTDTSSAGFLTANPTGGALLTTSNLNWSAGETVVNLAIVPVGSGGAVTFRNAIGTADLVIDLQGYFLAGVAAGGEYVPLAPQRITDTRPNSGYPNAGNTLGPGSTLDIQVAGEGGIPSAGVAAAVLNVTVTSTSAASFLAVYPGSEAEPGTSSLNWAAGGTVANRVVVPVNSSGQITVFNAVGTVNVVIDSSGYFTAGTSALASASLFYPLSPTRLLDTRADGSQLQPGSYLGEQFAATRGISPQATAVIANLTTTDTSAPGYFTVSPQESAPATSDLNWSRGATVANLDIAALSVTGDLYLYNSRGTADAVIDVFGYFVPASGNGGSAPQPCSSASMSTTTATVVDGPVGVTVAPSCPAGMPVTYTYWYRAPGAPAWTPAGPATSSSTFQFTTSGWASGTYQLLAWVSSQSGVFQGATGSAVAQYSTNPLTNLTDTFMSPCYGSGYGSVTCMEAEVAAINSARTGEGVVALSWPSSLYNLSPAQQEFVMADEERVGRGLPPIAGLTSAAGQVATQAAQSESDPDGFQVSG
ncbi:MAG TPA: hypothetical protein VMV09_09440, partial [Candidatus Saccharimonadales bacterium]|nr:hypothetical protein [Candidatus Saccharimonadales bacterium]